MNEPAESPPTARPGRRLGRWPFGFIAVAVLRLIDAGLLIVLGMEQRGMPVAELPILGGDSAITRVLDVTLAALAIAGVIGLLAFRRWGWVLTMVLVGLSLLADLIRVIMGEPDDLIRVALVDPVYIALALHVLTAFYLNGRSVRTLADRHFDRDAPGATATSPASAGPTHP